MKVENAIIYNATLSFEYDNRYLCLSLWLKTQRRMYKFGGVNLGSRYQKEFNRNTADYAFWWIKRIFDIANVESFDNLKGKTIRIEIDDNDFVHAIGHIIADDWFCPKKDFGEGEDESKQM